MGTSKTAQSWFETHNAYERTDFQKHLGMHRHTFDILLDGLGLYRETHGNCFETISANFSDRISTVLEAAEDVLRALFKHIKFPQSKLRLTLASTQTFH